MSTDWLTIPIAFAVTATFILAFRRTAIKLGLVDTPGGRKTHAREVPLVGGIAIFFGFTFAALLLQRPLGEYRALFAGMSILLIAGVLDDLRDLSAKHKFGIQAFAAAFLVFWGGLSIDSLGNLFGTSNIILGYWSIPFTFICTLGLINAINMSDGSDGLAGGIVFIMLIWIIVAAILAGFGIPIMPLILAAALLAFLLFNFPHPRRSCASVFMGDSGSMILGYAVAWFTIGIFVDPKIHIPPITVAAILSLPVFDTIILMIRRILKGKSPMAPDREHLHHIFERAGFSRQQTVYILITFAGFTGAIGIAGWQLGAPDWLILLILIAIFILHLFFVLRAWRTMRALRRLRRWNRTLHSSSNKSGL